MSNLILLLHNDADVAALPETAQRIVDHGYKGVWILVSPALASNTSSLAEKYDKEITDMQIAEKQAAERGDYNAAADLQLAKRGKIMDREKAIADNWKAIPEADRLPTIRQKITPLMTVFPGNVDAKVTITQDHYDPSNWVQLLNSLSGAWFAPMKIGTFSVAWPGAIPALGTKIPIVPQKPEITKEQREEYERFAKEQQKPAGDSVRPVSAPVTPPAKKKPEKRQPEPAATTPDARRAQLTSMPFFTRKSLCVKLGIEVKGKNTSALVDEILAKEFQAVA